MRTLFVYSRKALRRMDMSTWADANFIFLKDGDNYQVMKNRSGVIGVVVTKAQADKISGRL